VARDLTVNRFTPTAQGLVPAPGQSTGLFLRDDATWAAAGSLTVGGVPITSIQGTANQIAVSAAGGVATLSFPTNGVIVPAYAGGFALAVETGSSGAALDLDTTGSTAVYMEFSQSGTPLGYMAGVLTAGQMVADSVINDIVIRGQSAGIRLTTNAGASTALGINHAGNVSIAAPSSGVAATITALATQAALELSTGGLFQLDSSGSVVAVAMNSVGADYGQIYNVGTQKWALGYGASVVTPGTAVLTWNATGNVVIPAPSSGIPLTTTGPAGNWAVEFIGSSTSGSSYGLLVESGTTAADYALYITDYGNTAQYFIIKGDGSGTLGPSTSLGLSWNATGNVVIPAPPSGIGLQVEGPTAAGGRGFNLTGGVNATDYCAVFANAANSLNYMLIYGDGGLAVGNAPTGGTKGIGTINVSGGYYVNGAAISAPTTGSFTGTFNGYASPPTGTVTYTVVGNTVLLTFPAVSGTSNATSFNMTGLPAGIQPTHAQQGLTMAENSSAAVVTSFSINASSGTITFNQYLSGSFTTWTASGTKGFGVATTIQYSLA
jgi:hypothetical protein